MKFGLNLYSMRNRMGNEADFLSLANDLAAGGYSFMQYSGAPFDHEMIGRVTKASGLPVLLTHVPLDRILNDTDRLCEEHLTFGCHYIGLGSLPWELFEDEKKIKATIDDLNRAAERMQKNDCTFFYHNHFLEFAKFGSKTVFDYMIEEAPAIHFTLDTYWVQYGGADVDDFMKKLNGRMECVHLKDYAIDVKERKPVYAPLGAGTLDFKRLVPIAEKCGAKYFFVEQDNAADLPDGFKNILQSAEYIRKEL